MLDWNIVMATPSRENKIATTRMTDAPESFSTKREGGRTDEDMGFS
jgi:hypothetical protein